jgi:ribulose-phosphate 3-epimerase
MIKLAPSILASDFSRLGQELEIIERAGAQYAHIDVMDGCFVPNITIGPPVINSLRVNSKLVFDVHLMVDEPARYVEDFYKAGADIINVHAEACKHLHATVQKIKSCGVKVGVTLNPATNLEVLEYVLEELDMVLIMSVNPGFGGQKFIPSSLNKIEKLANMIQNKKLKTDIQIDGGVTLDNLKTVIDAGANVIVAGSAIYQKNHTAENVKRFLEICNQYN